MKSVLTAALMLLLSTSAFAQSITITVTGPIDGKQQSITKTYVLDTIKYPFADLLKLYRDDFCPKEPADPNQPKGPLVSKITDAQAIGCFTDYLGISTMQRITAYQREVKIKALTGEP